MSQGFSQTPIQPPVNPVELALFRRSEPGLPELWSLDFQFQTPKPGHHQDNQCEENFSQFSHEASPFQISDFKIPGRRKGTTRALNFFATFACQNQQRIDVLFGLPDASSRPQPGPWRKKLQRPSDTRRPTRAPRAGTFRSRQLSIDLTSADRGASSPGQFTKKLTPA